MADAKAMHKHGRPAPLARRALLMAIALWLAFQVLFPIRHLLYPGNVSWTEEGHRFSWQMKLRDKRADTTFYVREPTSGQEWVVKPRQLLARHQASKVGPRPDMVLQFAHYIERRFLERTRFDDLEVRAVVCASLNGRPAQLLIDPNRDLTRIERSLAHADWILPLTTPFERPPEGERRQRRNLDCSG